MTQQELVRIVLSKAPDEPRPVYHKPMQEIAELVYDPALAENDAEQLRAVSIAFEKAGDQNYRIAESLWRLASEQEG